MRVRLRVQAAQGASLAVVGDVALDERWVEPAATELFLAPAPREEAALIRYRLDLDDVCAFDGSWQELHSMISRRGMGTTNWPPQSRTQPSCVRISSRIFQGRISTKSA